MRPAGQVSLRAATVDDADALLAMMRLLYEHEGLPFPDSSLRRALLELLADPRLGGAFFLVSDGVPAGYALATWAFSAEQGGRFLFLDELLVLPDRRGKGLGSAALELLEEEARRGGAGAIRLEVATGNVRALDLYLASGYEDPGRLFLTKRLEPSSRG